MPNNYVNKYADFINEHWSPWAHKNDVAGAARYLKLRKAKPSAVDLVKDYIKSNYIKSKEDTPPEGIKSKKDTPPEDIKSKKDIPPEDMEGGPRKPKLTKADISQLMSAMSYDNMHHPGALKTPTVKRNKSDLK